MRQTSSSRNLGPGAVSAPASRSLYDPRFEHDGCGVGFVARISGSPGHDILEMALEAVSRLTHRGAVAADGRSGDGAGVLTQIPRGLFAREAAAFGVSLDAGSPLGVGMVFLPDGDVRARGRAETALDASLGAQGLRVLGWRDVPVDREALGLAARAAAPVIRQVLVLPGDGIRGLDAFERRLYLARKAFERDGTEGYVCSLSCRTVVYKALCAAHQLPRFYLDLADPLYETALAVYHQRYSTNTWPSWRLAQPLRLLGHNGEINTLWGNRAWLRARELELSPDLRPLLDETGSDSASLDEALELLARNGRELVHGLAMLIVPAWEERADLPPPLAAFYRYHLPLSEPWDGPAALAFSDGRWVGAALDRNGLRPCRYRITRDGLVVAGSEVGVVDLDAADVVERGRLAPGHLLVVDVESGRRYDDAEIKARLAAAAPYGQWLGARQVGGSVGDEPVTGELGDGESLASESVVAGADDGDSPGSESARGDLLRGEAGSGDAGVRGDRPQKGASRERAARAAVRELGAVSRLPAMEPTPDEDLKTLQRVFGYTREEVRLVLGPMVENAKPGTWSMGDDTPIAPLGRAPRSLYAFLRQRFAQVTNPAIDPLREASVMSVRTWLGPRPPLFGEPGPQPRTLELPTPVITAGVMARILAQDELPAVTVDCIFTSGEEDLPGALDRICEQAEAAVLGGAALLVLSDRRVGPDRMPVPMVLTVGAVHHRLLRAGLRTRLGLIAEAGDCWDDHHLAVLVGYGAGAVHPWLALATVAEDGESGAGERMIAAYEYGLRKILSKMGISTIASYRGAQLFDALGLADEVVNRCLTGTPNRIGGLNFTALEERLVARHAAAYAAAGTDERLPDHGLIRYRRGEDSEHHAWSPDVARALQAAVGSEKKSLDEPDPAAWDLFQPLGPGEGGAQLRDLLDMVGAGPALPLEAVEPVESIVRRFVTSPMSLGALSPEAHRTVAIAMNRLGARSNTGEGGEDPEVYEPLPNGDSAEGAIKQVASGRFGVTAEYLARARELEIKIAQGSKPGEGGQLPGHKVTELIARLRHSQPGVPLISPPPHHDIYSIEDLAQLIYDIKRCNPSAKVGVKLVSEVGVGTIAAGVAKAYADYVFICGHNGGTGASPLSSIKHAGAPWEIGLAETQQSLMRSGLRGRIRVRVDGGLMTARDVVIGALLGAEEFGFGTAALVAMGCDMARQCHLNTCPTGIATQDPERRKRFRGKPEQIVRYFTRLAEDVRAILATLGLGTLEEAVGRVDLLRQVHFPAGIDLGPLLVRLDGDVPRCVTERNDRPDPDEPIDEPLTRSALAAVDAGQDFLAHRPIRNRDRSIGARLAGALARRYGREGGIGNRRIELRFDGVAGQSFGAFAGPGMRLVLDGEANDYVGKGLSGGELVLRPTGATRDGSDRDVILGNVALYGATAGRLFAAGRAGERFAVRNSGAVAVVEGLGDHGCEYMTGGCVVVLGTAGLNFGAGMTGGVAYVLDETGGFPDRVNRDVVTLHRPTDADAEALRELLQTHGRLTGSRRAIELLERWPAPLARFWKVQGGGRLPNTPAARVADRGASVGRS